MQHSELVRTGKFLLFSCSAGLIELGSFALFNEAFHWPYWGAYLTALVLSVLWNFTCNRRYTFRSTDAGILEYLRGRTFQVPQVAFAEKYFPGFTLPDVESEPKTET